MSTEQTLSLFSIILLNVSSTDVYKYKHYILGVRCQCLAIYFEMTQDQ